MEFQPKKSKAFDDTIKFEKARAIASFNRQRTVMRLWQFTKLAAAFAAITWCSCSPVVASLPQFSSRVFFNHHVVFLIGNAIIVSLVMLCRESGTERRDGDDEYVEPATEEVATVVECDDGDGGGCGEQTDNSVAVECDDVEIAMAAAAAIERATRQIRRFERTHSEALRREIAVRPELERSETESYREKLTSEAVEIEKLTNEEFRRTVDAFIHKYWPKARGTQIGIVM